MARIKDIFRNRGPICLTPQLERRILNYLGEEGMIERTPDELIDDIIGKSSLVDAEKIGHLITRWMKGKISADKFYRKVSSKVGKYAFYDYMKAGSIQTVQDGLRELVKMTRLGPKDKILDAGCGTGLEAVFLAELLEAGYIHAIDPSKGMIERAKERSQRRKMGNIEFKNTPIENMTYPDEGFDVISCINALYEGTKKMRKDQLNQCVGGRIMSLDRGVNSGGRLFLAIANHGEVEQNIEFQTTVLRKNLEESGYSNFKFNNLSRLNNEGEEINHSYLCFTKD